MEKDQLIRSVKKEDAILFYLDEYSRGIGSFRFLRTRRKIYDLISENPGLHLSMVADMLKIRISLVEYHLQHMKKDGLIITSKEKGYSRYYIGDSEIGTKDKKILSLLRQEIPLNIVLFLIKNPKSKHTEIASGLGMTTSKLSYHLHKLVKLNIVSAPDMDDDGRYSIRNIKEIRTFLRKYQLQTVVDRFLDTWDDL